MDRRGSAIGSGNHHDGDRYMSNLSPFALVGHYRGVGSSLDATTLTTPDYLFAYSPLIQTSRVSSVKWIEASNLTDTPTKRVFRANYDTWLAYFITVKMKSSNYQTRIRNLEIGYKRFTRPSHVHCIPTVDRYYENDAYFADGLEVVYQPATSPTSDIIVSNWNFKCMVGSDVVPYPICELYAAAPGVVSNIDDWDSSKVIGRLVGNASGEVKGMTARNNLFGVGTSVLYMFRSPDGFYQRIDRSTPFSNNEELQLNYQFVGPTGKVYEEVWPTDTFTAWGATQVPKGKDWLPPVMVQATTYAGPYGYDPTPLEYDCYMTLLRLDSDTYNRYYSNTTYGGASMPGLRTLSNTVTPTPFPVSRHADLDAGWYRRKTSYPSTYAAGPDRWEPCPGSDPTGYDPPTSEPTCPFVAKRGTEE